MIRVRAPSRLHFGLLNLCSESHWTNLRGEKVIPARQFGSVGLMVEAPGIQLTVKRASSWSAEGPLGVRALAYARRVAESLPASVVQPQQIAVEQAAPEHFGLGTGTQLAMAVARALTAACGMGQLQAVELARLCGRGARSALGTHGFMQGGFLVEAGKRHAEEISPLVARLAFPEQWRLLIILPPWRNGLHGSEETKAFELLYGQDMAPATTDTLCRLVLLGMLPALAERDLEAFGEAVYDFNARVGTLFASIQGGNYAHPGVAELVEWVRRQGVRGVGQSSWGPAVFAVVGDEEKAEHLASRIRVQFRLEAHAVLCTPACIHGARLDNV